MDNLETLSKYAENNNLIRNEHYHMYEVKRGLRNADGSGVLVGLTNVSSVIGYEKIDEEVIPIEGRLFYRGIDIGELVRGFEEEDRFGFEETVFLLLFGQLPNIEELEAFTNAMAKLRRLARNFTRDVLQTFRTRDIMNAISRSVLTLYGPDVNAEDLSTANQIRQAVELIARVNTIVAYAYYSIQHGFHRKSMIIHRNNPSLSMAQNFLHLLRPNSSFTEIEARTLDAILVLHADHGGGNNSTFTARVVSSTLTDIYSAIAAAIGSLKGPLHGGANTRVSLMMDDLKKNVKKLDSRRQVRNYLFRVLNKKSYDRSGKIYGIGHPVYTLSDPRAVILREYARRLCRDKGLSEEFALYELVGREAPEVLREFKNNPNLMASTNVDFYSGLIYDCLDIPREVYTPLFAMARIAGWCAHRIEMISNPSKVVRPAFKSISGRREYKRLDDRVNG